ncbi:hypothetical protein Bca52824_050960 [Brassica carinata]|uniref:Uncharacterized protein n=1 Tax=Brassica carinata TaxID=52824 RepID=A0A8X7R0A2_BRACI|nr:hypothetical protein Bca52824_050960 [Brassica carinata]
MCVGVSGLGVLRLEVFWLGVVVYGHPDTTLVLLTLEDIRARSSESASSEVVRGVDLPLSFGFLGDTAWDFSASQCLWWSLDSIGSVVSISFEGLRAWTGG